MVPNILETRSNRLVLKTLLVLISILLAQPPSARAQCAGIPLPLIFDDQQPNSNIVEAELPVIIVDPEFGVIAVGMDGAVGVDGCGRFMVAWTVDSFPSGDPFFPNDDSIVIQRILPDGVLSASVESLTANQPFPPISSKGEANLNPSIAVSPTGNVRVAWIADCEDCRTGEPNSTFNVTGITLRTDFAFDQSPPIAFAPYPEADFDHADPSAGRSDTGTGRTGWSSQGQERVLWE